MIFIAMPLVSQRVRRNWETNTCSDDKEFVCKARDPGLIPGLGRFFGEGNGYSPPTPVSLPGEFHGQRSLA